MTCKFEISGPHRLTCRAVRKLLQAFTRRHVPCATNRLMTGTIVVPAFWRVEWRHAGPDRTSRSGAIPENAWTHILTDKHGPANYFSPTHRRKSSFIERSMLKHLNVHSLRFWTKKYVLYFVLQMVGSGWKTSHYILQTTRNVLVFKSRL